MLAHPTLTLCPRALAARLVLIGAAAATPTWGQSQPPEAATPAAPAASEPVQLPAVRVTADGRGATTEGSKSYTTGSTSTATGLSLSPRETPQSVTVVTRERLDDQALSSITDVVHNTTGITAKALDPARFSYSARGFDITNLQIDGIPTTWEAGWSAGETSTDTAIYDRVEIVRGATGLVTGAGSPAAAINLVRKRANSRELSGTASIEYGSRRHLRGEVDVGTPLTADGRVRGRIVAAYQDAESHMDLAEEKISVLYGVVDADLGASTRLSVGTSYQKTDPRGTMWGGLPSWYADGTRTNWERSKTTAASWSTWESTQSTVFADLEHRFDNDWALRGSLSRSENKGDMRLLFLYGAPDRTTGLGMGASPANYATSREQDNASIHASGPFSLLGRQHEASFGLIHSRQDFKSDSRDAQGTPADVGDFNQWNGAAYPEPTWGPSYSYERFKTEQDAAYAVARFSLADPLKLIVGARLTRWKTDGNGLWMGTYLFDEKELTPYAGLVWDITADTSAYASYTDIFQPQNSRDVNGRYLDPAIGKGYELGVKSEFFDGRLNAALALFRIQQDNLAQPDGSETVPGTNPPQQAYYAAQGVKSEGYEIDIAGEITRGWDLSLGWSQFWAKDANGTAVNTSHPRRTLKLFTKYRFDGALQGLQIGGGVNWESENYTDAENPVFVVDRLEQPSFAVAHLMARYDFTRQLTAQINIDNLFDKKYYSQIGFYGQYAYAAPRSATVSLKYRF